MDRRLGDDSWTSVSKQVADLWTGPKVDGGTHWMVCKRDRHGNAYSINTTRAADELYAFICKAAKETKRHMDPEAHKMLLGLRAVTNPRGADGAPDPQYPERASKALKLYGPYLFDRMELACSKTQPGDFDAINKVRGIATVAAQLQETLAACPRGRAAMRSAEASR